MFHDKQNKMTAKQVNKYKKYPVSKLLEIAQRHFNEYIRLRDKSKPCISCGQYTTLQAGHYFSAGHHSALRFDENNCHGQCIRCNMHLSGNLIEYTKCLPDRITEVLFEELEQNKLISRRSNHKWDRFTLIDIICKYKQKVKELK